MIPDLITKFKQSLILMLLPKTSFFIFDLPNKIYPEWLVSIFLLKHET
jgi:hypothetical protein